MQEAFQCLNLFTSILVLVTIVMAVPLNELVKAIRDLLDRLHRSRHLDKDEREAVFDEVATEARSLQIDGILDALDIAVGKNSTRQENAIYLLVEWTALPEVVERIDRLLTMSDKEDRAFLISLISFNRLDGFAARLIPIIEFDTDSHCRDMAIHAAAKLKSLECLPTILRLADEGDPKLSWRIATALASYATEDCRSRLDRLFADSTMKKSTRIFAAWGLAKLGEQRAVDYLIEMLDDPDDRGPSHYYPGESLRAAQALCDIFGWPYERNKLYVATVKEFVSKRH